MHDKDNCFLTHINNWELGEVESLLHILFPLAMRNGLEDILRWEIKKNGGFSVSSLYRSYSRTLGDPFSGV